MDFYGPIAGSRHVSFLLSDSNLLRDLAVLYPNHEFSIFGDPAYPQSGWLFGGFCNPAPGDDEALFNKEMSSVREAVEWGFKEVVAQFRFLDLKNAMKIYESPIGQYYIVGMFFQNIRTCFYSNQTSYYFNCKPMDLKTYFDLA
jgi:DDE superfamily endonuclease